MISKGNINTFLIFNILNISIIRNLSEEIVERESLILTVNKIHFSQEKNSLGAVNIVLYLVESILFFNYDEN